MAKVREVPMTMEYCGLMNLGVEFAETQLGLTPPIDPYAAQRVIEDCLEQHRNGTFPTQDEHTAEYLGLFWALTLMLAFEWKPVAVMYEGNPNFGVSDPLKKYLALPVSFFHWLAKPDFDRTIPGPADRFEAIREGHMPPSRPDTFTIITL